MTVNSSDVRLRFKETRLIFRCFPGLFCSPLPIDAHARVIVTKAMPGTASKSFVKADSKVENKRCGSKILSMNFIAKP